MDNASKFEAEVRSRAGDLCELCQATEALAAIAVPPGDLTADRCVLACLACRSQIQGDSAIDAKHWFCLKESIWSEVPAVQVVGYRMLKRLGDEGWAQDLLGQVYLEEDTQAWASAETGDAGTGGADAGDSIVTLDSNGAVLADGDSVTLIKDLDVKGGGFVAKRGTMVKNIRLIDDPENIEARVNKMTLVLKTKFLKKVG
jgi:protein PhnA